MSRRALAVSACGPGLHCPEAWGEALHHGGEPGWSKRITSGQLGIQREEGEGPPAPRGHTPMTELPPTRPRLLNLPPPPPSLIGRDKASTPGPLGALTKPEQLRFPKHRCFQAGLTKGTGSVACSLASSFSAVNPDSPVCPRKCRGALGDDGCKSTPNSAVEPRTALHLEGEDGQGG